MSRLIKLLDDHFEEGVIFVSLSAMSVIIALQVIMRYAFQASLSWSEEVARYLFIWLIYIGISYGVKRQAHVSVTAIELVISPKARKVMRLVACIIFFCFALCMCWYGRQVCATIGRLGQQSPAMDLPMWVVYAAVPTGFTLTCIRLIQRIIEIIRTWHEPDPDPTAEAVL